MRDRSDQRWVELNLRWKSLHRQATDAELAGDREAVARLEAAARATHKEILAMARAGK